MPASIAIIAINAPLPEAFDYLATSLDDSDIGCRVLVPFGSKQRVGVLVGLRNSTDLPVEQLRPVIEKLDETPILDRSTIELLLFASRYYQQPPGQFMFAALPNLLRLARKPGQPRRRRSSPDTPGLPPVILNDEQLAVTSHIAKLAGQFQPVLLHGVTGSGKTEIYLQLIEKVLAAGGQVLMLVPEIRLTPQLHHRLADRFADQRIAILHSDISPARRMHDWLAAGRGDIPIVLGTRLAVFTPMPRLQLIIVDEEHDASFQQQEGLRYSARDLAVVRASKISCPVVLGSATPSLESWFNAGQGKYLLLSLTRRAAANARLPDIGLIDMRGLPAGQGISPPLREALRQNLLRGEQSLLFINRRGFAPALYCQNCNWVAGCSRCSSKLVLHRHRQELRCHHCGLSRPVPPSCPECGHDPLFPAGAGTQRIEQILEQLFPQARLLRIDSDTAASPGQWQAMRETILARQADILIGTQLVSKGHDFPHLTLVGVLAADDALYSSDFRADERLFAQLLQVSGRAGRADHPGQVLIQTAWPQHPLFQALCRHDYPGYAASMLAQRKLGGFPPFRHLVALRADAPTLEEALGFLQRARALAPAATDIDLFDPVAETLLRKGNRERALLIAQASSRPLLQAWLADWLARVAGLPTGKVRWKPDVDAQQV